VRIESRKRPELCNQAIASSTSYRISQRTPPRGPIRRAIRDVTSAAITANGTFHDRRRDRAAQLSALVAVRLTAANWQNRTSTTWRSGTTRSSRACSVATADRPRPATVSVLTITHSVHQCVAKACKLLRYWIYKGSMRVQQVDAQANEKAGESRFGIAVPLAHFIGVSYLRGTPTWKKSARGAR
jgi:hypothetical protein